MRSAQTSPQSEEPGGQASLASVPAPPSSSPAQPPSTSSQAARRRADPNRPRPTEELSVRIERAMAAPGRDRLRLGSEGMPRRPSMGSAARTLQSTARDRPAARAVGGRPAPNRSLVDSLAFGESPGVPVGEWGRISIGFQRHEFRFGGGRFPPEVPGQGARLEGSGGGWGRGWAAAGGGGPRSPAGEPRPRLVPGVPRGDPRPRLVPGVPRGDPRPRLVPGVPRGAPRRRGRSGTTERRLNDDRTTTVAPTGERRPPRDPPRARRGRARWPRGSRGEAW